MTDQSVAGDVCATAQTEFSCRRGCVGIESRHGGDSPIYQCGACLAALDGGADDAEAERFGQHQRVAGPSAALEQDDVWVDLAEHGESVFGSRVNDAVATGQQCARVRNCPSATAQQ